MWGCLHTFFFKQFISIKGQLTSQRIKSSIIIGRRFSLLVDLLLFKEDKRDELAADPQSVRLSPSFRVS